MSYAAFGEDCDSALQTQNGDQAGAAFWVGNYDAFAVAAKGGTVQQKPNTLGYYGGAFGDKTPCDLQAYNTAYAIAFSNSCQEKEGIFSQSGTTLSCAFPAPQPSPAPTPSPPAAPAMSNKTLPIVLGLGAVALLAWALL